MVLSVAVDPSSSSSMAPLPCASPSSFLIGTHDGTFHCDEALGCSLLLLLPPFAHATVIRTRDPIKLAQCDLILDVGALYSHSNLRYDHHQREFNETLSEKHQIKLSSAGLIYKHYGRQVLQRIIATLKMPSSSSASSSSSSSASSSSSQGVTLTDEELELVYYKVYSGFVEALDAIDNGISLYNFEPGHELKPRYRSSTDLSSRVGNLNPQWNEACSRDEMDERFQRAMKLTGEEFIDHVKYVVCSWLPARHIVLKAVEQRCEFHPSGQIMVFRSQSAAWKSHLFDIEKDLSLFDDDNKHILYVLFEDSNGGQWRVQAVNKPDSQFDSRKPLPEPWRGIRDEALSSLTGIPGCVFVHSSGFIGGVKSYEGALALAVAAWGWPTESANKRLKADS